MHIVAVCGVCVTTENQQPRQDVPLRGSGATGFPAGSGGTAVPMIAAGIGKATTIAASAIPLRDAATLSPSDISPPYFAAGRWDGSAGGRAVPIEVHWSAGSWPCPVSPWKVSFGTTDQGQPRGPQGSGNGHRSWQWMTRMLFAWCSVAGVYWVRKVPFVS